MNTHVGVKIKRPGAATADLCPTRVVWRLDQAKAAGVSEGVVALGALRGSGRTAGHFYLDMTGPAETLATLATKFIDVLYPWVSPE